jgi:anti-repressor protein
MNELMNTGNEEQRMSSREIAELTGKRHDHVMRDIVNLNKTYEGMGLPKVGDTLYTHPQNGETYKEFLLTKMQSLDLMTGYKPDLRIKVNRRWEKLEKERAIVLPNFNDPVESARAWADQVEKRQIAEKERRQLQVQAVRDQPKIAFYNDVIKTPEYFKMEEVAKLLAIDGYGRNNLFKFLREKKVLSKNNYPYQRFVKEGYFKLNEYWDIDNVGEYILRTIPVVSNKGIEYIRKLVRKEIESKILATIKE